MTGGFSQGTELIRVSVIYNSQDRQSKHGMLKHQIHHAVWLVTEHLRQHPEKIGGVENLPTKIKHLIVVSDNSTGDCKNKQTHEWLGRLRHEYGFAISAFQKEPGHGKWLYDAEGGLYKNHLKLLLLVL